MEAIQIRQRLRPLRYAFLVKNEDVAAAARAASIASALWGGRYNPIVPAEAQPTDDLGHPQPPFERRDGLLKAFDPDALVNLTGERLASDLAGKYQDRIVPGDEVIRTVNGGHALSIGMSITPMLRSTYEREVRFLSEPTRARLPEPDHAAGWPEFVALAYGSFQFIHELRESLEKRYRDSLRASNMPLPALAAPPDFREVVFPLAYGSQGLRLFSQLANVSSHVIFVGDHRSALDLTCFWNMRATGRDIGFVPVDGFRNFEHVVRAIAEAGRYPINPSVMNEPTIQKGPSVDEAMLAPIVEWMRELGVVTPPTWWTPRFGMEQELYVGDIHVAELQAYETEETSFLHEQGLTPVKMIAPPLVDRIRAGQHRWAVDVSLHSYRESDFMFVFPSTPGVEEVVRRSIGGRREARLVDRGHAISLRQDAVLSTLHLPPVRTKDVFAAMFEEAGFRTEPSLAGRYAEQIIKKMGSLQQDCRVFKLRGVRDVLDRLGDGAKLTKGNIVQFISKTDPDEHGQNWRGELYESLVLRRDQRVPLRPGTVFDVMLDKQILRPGLVFKCRTCYAKDWYHVSEFSEEFTCRYCFMAQRVNFARAREWQYRSDGMFRIPDSARGSVAVILSLWRLNQIGFLERGSYVTSFHVTPRDSSWPGCEIDYAHLVPDKRGEGLRLVLGQAERFGEFKVEDMDNMMRVADRFNPKPYLAFSTLRDAFSDPDRGRFRDLASRGYGVIALTREELDRYELFDRFKAAPHKHGVGLKELAENTMHLNVGSA